MNALSGSWMSLFQAFDRIFVNFVFTRCLYPPARPASGHNHGGKHPFAPLLDKIKALAHPSPMSTNKILEWAGVISAIAYTFLVASNTGREFGGFALLLLSALLIGAWALRERHWGILFLQFFYAGGAILGMVNWG